ncbi:MAG: GntR family transcriptional regulator [Anaerolineales bacterium]|jgi:GntR family transcriptional regulator
MNTPYSRVEQVADQLRSLINARYFSDGRLPSEPDLARRMGASRATIRQALERLARGGLIVRRHGVGTFVNHQVLNIRTRLEEVWDFDEMIRQAGYLPNVRHLELELDNADTALVEKLALTSGEEVIITANVFQADSVPVIYCVDTIPASLVQQAYREEELHGPVYTFLERRCSQRVDYNITQITPIVADKHLGQLLDCPLGVPLHYFEETGYNTEGKPIIYSEEYYRPEYFSFKVVRKMTTLNH